MACIGIDITRREPYADGISFGDAGPYERIDAWATFAVDPEHSANAAITDLQLAPRDEEGLVHFAADLCLLLPADPERGARRMLLELPNRGRKLGPRILSYAKPDPTPSRAVPPGDGFLLNRGWVSGWIGWQWDVIRSEALMGLEPPRAGENGQLPGTTVVRFQPNNHSTSHLLADRIHQPYPAADPNQPDARLTVSDYPGDKQREIPRDAWRFAREDNGVLVDDPTYVSVDGGFDAGRIYHVYYQTNLAPVVGCGLLAVRDIASFLKYDTTADNPLAGAVDFAYAWGMSQTGRMLREFLYLGLNIDEQGRQVYDGLNPHVGGARRGEFNLRYGQPSVQGTPSPGFLPPHGDAELVNRSRELGVMPKVIQTNSSAEYWRGDGALMHIALDGSSDLPNDPDMRGYHFAGTQHGPGEFPRGREAVGSDGSKGRHDFNLVDYRPLHRAALVHLDAWASQNVEPPESAHPRLDDGTAIRRAEVFDAFESFPPLADNLPDPDRILNLPEVDAGPDADKGIVRHPVTEGALRPDFVAALDDDFNEVAGLRLPDLTVPLATHTGWNPRDPESGAPEQIIPMQGMTFFFARDEVEREVNRDPRPSIAARYAGRDDYLAQVRFAAEQLAAERRVLDEDIERCVDAAAERWDYVMGGGY